MTLHPPPRKHYWVWVAWLFAFYSTWLWLMFGEDMWPTAIAHWPIALSMAFGSYIAGSTPMGGGTVGFPILVLLFEFPASLGRDFSFAIQSIGMTSASIFILARRQPLAWSMLKGALAGSLIGTPIGLLFIAPLVPDLWIKLAFAIIWCSFGVLHLYRLGEIAAHEGMTEFDEHWDISVGFLVGLFSGVTVVAVTGVGIDMVIYATLVLLCRCDLKIAIPTSVALMAFTSLLGIGVKALLGDVQPGVFEQWLAAAPVVALGAPLGVFIVALIGRRPTLVVVALLCVVQFAWTLYSERQALGQYGFVLALIAVGTCLIGFERLRRRGAALVGERQARDKMPGS